MISVIIVEDEEMIRSGIRKHVNWKQLGVEDVRTAANAEEALRISEEKKPDIIISDIHMPGRNGIELCTELHARYPGKPDHLYQRLFRQGISEVGDPSRGGALY
jgi:two-component system response regulator YesN